MTAPSFVCPDCGAVSYNLNDVAERYCGRCHAFVDDAEAERLAAARRAAEAYLDDTFPERPCDYCGKLYRGPAVYCSLECAVDDP